MKEKISNFLHDYYFPFFGNMNYSSTMSIWLCMIGFTLISIPLKFKEGVIIFGVFVLYFAGDLIMKALCDEDE